MGLNREKPHLYILVEDDANQSIINGFEKNNELKQGAIHVARVKKDGKKKGDWLKVVDLFKEKQIKEMNNYPDRYVTLVIDFDADEGTKVTYKERLDYAEKKLNTLKEEIPFNLRDRVFILGVLSEPEKLKKALNKDYEEIGEKLSEDCANNTSELWGHELLKHNKQELEKMVKCVKLFLFPN